MKKIIVILVMAVVSAMSAVAQEAVVKSFETAQTDLTAQQYSRLDRNGVKCAVVKVRVIAPGVEFRGNVMGEPEKHTGEYWVYMTHGTKMVQIAAETFLPFMFNFPEPLQGGVTYNLTILAPQPVISGSPASITGSTIPFTATSPSFLDTDPYADDIDLTDKYERFWDLSTDKYGFKHNGTIVIPARYDLAGSFSEGLAGVKINGKWGFIDKSGTLVIPAKYKSAEKFSEGLAMVKVKNKYGFIDKNGTLVIPAKYVSAGNFSEGLAKVLIDGKWGFIDKGGNQVITTDYDCVLDFHEGLAGVKDTPYIDGRLFLEGKWGYIDKTGKLVIPMQYEDCDDFSEGRARVEINGKKGYIDTSGKLVIPAIYYGASKFKNGVASVQAEYYSGSHYIDLDGNKVE